MVYRGNLEKYFKQLDDLRFYHHIDPCAAHSIAAKPFGPEFQARVRTLDKEAGRGGIAFPVLKELIRAHCSERGFPTCADKTSEGRRKDERRRENLSARAALVDRSDRLATPTQGSRNKGHENNWRVTPPNSIPLTTRVPGETRDYFCLVCGDRKHIWTQCQQRQARGCAACGSEAHLVRSCSQRWRQAAATPHRWDRVSEDANRSTNGRELSEEEQPAELSGVAARRVGIYSSTAKGTFPQYRKQAVSLLKNGTPGEEEEEIVDTATEAPTGLPIEEVFVDPSTGIAPCPSGSVLGELLYPIKINNSSRTALWDPGAGASFVSARLAQSLGLDCEALPHPIRLAVWDGPGVVITQQVFVKEVEFGPKKGTWTFMVDPVLHMKLC